MDLPESVKAWFRRPIGRAATVALGVLACVAPAYLFADALATPALRGDDWAYIAASRTFDRARENLFTPHNVHVVPAWRALTAVVVAASGRLSYVRPAFAAVAYLILVATIVSIGRFVARETARPTIGLAAMIATGTSALMYPVCVWYSASQAPAAAVGIVLMLGSLQSWRRRGGIWRLGLAVGFALLASGTWTAGYVAGPVGAAYLLADGRRRSILAAALPLVATVVAAGAVVSARGSAIQEQSKVSFHGRHVEEAIHPGLAPTYTAQAIVERLLIGGLGVPAEVEGPQAVVLLLGIAAAWLASRRSAPSPLEAAGATLVVSSYLVLMIFRTYLPFSSLRNQVPWYDTIPLVGVVFFAAGWWDGLLREPIKGVEPVRRGGALTLVAILFGLLALHGPRVEALFFQDTQGIIRRMTAGERKKFPIAELQRSWAKYLGSEFVVRQDTLLRRLERSETIARANGIGREALVALYGRSIWPVPPVVDDAELLAIPKTGPTTDPTRIRNLIGPPFLIEPETRPWWVGPDEPWPPPKP